MFTIHFTDDVAFRASWTTLAQIPLVYLLSSKRGPFNYLTGLSYDRVNWLHRLVGRMIFLSATTHGAIMLSSIDVEELIRSSEEPMRVVRFGAGAYTMLIWIAITSLMGVRKRWFWAFHANHWISTISFLVLALNHVPSYARAPIYSSIAIVAIDKSLVACRYLWINMSIRPQRLKYNKFGRTMTKSREVQTLAMGHMVKMMTPTTASWGASAPEPTTLVRICDVPFSWKPGQHVRIYIPRLGAFETHPFTPATCPDVSYPPFSHGKNADEEDHGLLESHTQTNDIILMIKPHSGLTRRLAEYYGKWLSLPCPNATRPCSSLTAFLDGPYGNSPTWEDYENLVLLATSSGVSFILSILDYLEMLCFQGDKRLRTRQICFIWSNRHIEPQFEAVVLDLIHKHSSLLRELDIKVQVEFYVTCANVPTSISRNGPEESDPFAHLRGLGRRHLARRPPLRIRNPNAPAEEEGQEEEEEVRLSYSSPVTEATESRSSMETYVSSTLIDEEQFCLPDSESLANESETTIWTRFRLFQLPLFSQRPRELYESCRCTLLRHSMVKAKAGNVREFVTTSYGVRPDLNAILSTAIPCTNSAKTMVVVCGNIGMIAEVRSIVAAMNLEFARGQREGSLDLHTEGAL